ncbi:MAG: hypothetical protein ABF887_12565, partial [Gluconobacter oxydans]|uniref:hypothetical protein n=1 Tax=Gluconobacter oxydans TaxID=442 RepID=UPI0039EB9D31
MNHNGCSHPPAGSASQRATGAAAADPTPSSTTLRAMRRAGIEERGAGPEGGIEAWDVGPVG